VRILVLQESDWIERGPHQSHHLLERLALRGHAVRVLDFEIGRRAQSTKAVIAARANLVAPPKVVEGSRIEVVRPAAIHFPILDYASVLVMHSLEIRRQFRDFRPDVVLGFGLLNAFVGIRAAKKLGVPFVYYLIDELHRLVREPCLRGFAHLIEGANVRRATLVLAINQALGQYAVEMAARPDQTKVLPAGVDVSRFAVPGDRSAVRKRHGLDEKDLVLFFMGWVYPFSGLREIAQRLTRGEGRNDNIKLLVVGKGDSWDELLQVSKSTGIEDNVKLVEFRPYSEMPSYLASADICLLPAHDVPTMRNIVPIKMYEYLAAAKPVIATRLPGLVKEFGEGNGVVYVNGPDEVLSKASELARHGELQELGERGRAFVSKNDWAKITETFESYLLGLINKQGSRLR
jgi:glycosyltransferase involved in cell wall biosynthesis